MPDYSVVFLRHYRNINRLVVKLIQMLLAFIRNERVDDSAKIIDECTLVGHINCAWMAPRLGRPQANQDGMESVLCDVFRQVWIQTDAQ